MPIGSQAIHYVDIEEGRIVASSADGEDRSIADSANAILLEQYDTPEPLDREITVESGETVTSFQEAKAALADGGPEDSNYDGVSGPLVLDENGDPKGFYQVFEVVDHDSEFGTYISGEASRGSSCCRRIDVMTSPQSSSIGAVTGSTRSPRGPSRSTFGSRSRR
ncbi:hypothetical protein JCM9743_00050 [Natrinema sp. JCM 9743]